MNHTSGDPPSPIDEPGAQRLLFDAGVLRALARCPSCGGTDLRRIRRDRTRCRICAYEWGARRGSILEGMRISFRTFLSLARCFADNVPVSEAARRTNISYNTAHEAYHRIRSAILATEEDRGLRTGRTIVHDDQHGPDEEIVFGIRLVENHVVIARITRPDPGIITSLPVPIMQRGNILFIDSYGKTYQGFITYRPGRNGTGVVRIRARNGMPWSRLGDFWEFAGRMWASCKGVDRDKIPAFLLELAFRYNNRGADILPLVLDRIALAYT